MKRVLIGGFMALLGTLWGAGVIIAASQMLVTSWDPAIGRLMATVLERGLALPFIVSALFLLFGIVIMIAEFFRKKA